MALGARHGVRGGFSETVEWDGQDKQRRRPQTGLLL
jgi:hypothetical protein